PRASIATRPSATRWCTSSRAYVPATATSGRWTTASRPSTSRWRRRGPRRAEIVSGSEGMAAQFRERGYVVRPGLLDPAEVSHYRAHLGRLSGRSSEWFARRRAGWLPGGLRDAWTLPDGVTRTPEFWPLLFHVPLLDAVRAVIGRDARYLQHTD